MTPRRPGFQHIAMRWHEPTYLHLPADSHFRPPLPPGLSLDQFDGAAWIGVACFRVERMRPFGLPIPPPWNSLPWVNIRTYVDGPEGPGVWFLSMHIPSRIVATGVRTGSHQPAHHAAVHIDTDANHRTYTAKPKNSSTQFSLVVDYPTTQPGSASHLERFFAGRPIEYVANHNRLAVVDTWHEPMVTTPTTDFEVDGLPVLNEHLERHRNAEPICHVSPGVDVRMSFPRRPNPTVTEPRG